jgi:hypothetical protein
MQLYELHAVMRGLHFKYFLRIWPAQCWWVGAGAVRLLSFKLEFINLFYQLPREEKQL